MDTFSILPLCSLPQSYLEQLLLPSPFLVLQLLLAPPMVLFFGMSGGLATLPDFRGLASITAVPDASFGVFAFDFLCRSFVPNFDASRAVSRVGRRLRQLLGSFLQLLQGWNFQLRPQSQL